MTKQEKNTKKNKIRCFVESLSIDFYNASLPKGKKSRKTKNKNALDENMEKLFRQQRDVCRSEAHLGERSV